MMTGIIKNEIGSRSNETRDNSAKETATGPEQVGEATWGREDEGKDGWWGNGDTNGKGDGRNRKDNDWKGDDKHWIEGSWWVNEDLKGEQQFG